MTPQRILANVSRDEFVGREAELQQIVSQASRLTDRRRMLVLAAPGVGAGELFRQTFDELFLNRGEAVPVYFTFQANQDLLHNARTFFTTLLRQYVAYRRVDPSLCNASLTFHELAEIAAPTDHELISTLLEAFDRERAQSDSSDLFEFCLSAPQRLSQSGRTVFPLINTAELGVGQPDRLLAEKIAGAFNRSRGSFALAGLRRDVLDTVLRAGDAQPGEVIRLEKLSGDDARRLAINTARRYGVDTNEPTRDLIAQQFDGNAFFIDGFLQAARERKISLTTFLECQRLYVDELMGGRIDRRFADLLEDAAPNPQTRRNLLRELYEAASGQGSRSSLWSWKKRIGADATEFDRIIDALHIHELVNSTAAFVEVNTASYIWTDYLRARYRADVTGEPRALIVAGTLMDSLKRAPQRMARHYRREAALGIRELITQFDCQEVPASLLHYHQFAELHKGARLDQINAALDSEAELIRLPQIVHVTSCAAFDATTRWEEERCAVAHGFEAAEYTEENEVVWLAAEIDSKLAVSPELAKEWLDRLTHLARECGFARTRYWLISREGFSDEASDLLGRREVFTSSEQQIELISDRITFTAEAKEEGRDEYEMVIPMGGDTEMVAAHTVDQIARRVNFTPEAINQIKTALVEACINAAEHSLSPDRRIYNRFRIEPVKLIVTVSSRGLVPANLLSRNGTALAVETEGEKGKGQGGKGKSEASRRVWGLKLIRSLMDEVEFRRVDDGTELKMVKFVRS